MVGSIVESLLLALVLLAGLAAVAVVAAGFLLWRYGRRKVRALRSHGAVVGAAALWDYAAASRWNRSGSVAAPAELRRWTSARAAREMWRAVDRAAAAVRAADELGAPTAELPSLCRRLRAAAVDVDKVLRVDRAARVPASSADQVLEVMRAAADVQRAAVTSAGAVSGDRIRDLTEDAGREVDLLDGGLAAMRASGARPLTP